MIRSNLLLLFCVTMWGSNFVFGAILVKEFSPMVLAATRLLFTSAFLYGYARVTNQFVRLEAKEWRLLVILGLVGTLLNQTAYFHGLQTTDATTASLIFSLSPIMSGLLAAVFLKEKLTRAKLLGSAIALCGVYFVVGKGSSLAFSGGIWMIFTAMLTMSISLILVRKLAERISAFIATVYSTMAGTILLAPVAYTVEWPGQFSHSWGIWILLILSAIMMQGICGLIWNDQLKKVGVGSAAVFLNLQPFVAMVVGFLLLGTTVTWTQLAGSFLIVGGVLIASVKMKRTRVPAAQKTEAV